MSPDPALGKYLPARDKEQNKNLPAGGVFNPINLNPYGYSGNNPLSYKDPDGQIIIPIIVGLLLYKYLTSKNNNYHPILQTNPRINVNDKIMSSYGCNFRSLQNIVERELKRSLKPEQINQARKDLIEKGIIDKEDLYVRNPEKVINDAFERLGSKFTATHIGNENEYLPYIPEKERTTDDTVVIGITNTETNTTHIRSGDKKGNVIFDPDKNASKNIKREGGFYRFRINRKNN